MANPTNSVDVRIPLATFRTQYAELFVNLKKDQAGEEVALENVNEAPGQLYGNANDDVILRVIGQFARRFFDNRQAIPSASRVPAAAPLISVSALAAATSFDFEIVSGLRSGTMLWAKLVATTSADADLELFTAATRLAAERVYAAIGVDPSTAFIEGTPSTMIDDTGGDLDGTLYGRITNNAGAPSDFDLETVLEGIAG